MADQAQIDGAVQNVNDCTASWARARVALRTASDNCDDTRARLDEAQLAERTARGALDLTITELSTLTGDPADQVVADVDV